MRVRAAWVGGFLASSLGHGLDMTFEIWASKVKHGGLNGCEQFNVTEGMVVGSQLVFLQRGSVDLPDLIVLHQAEGDLLEVFKSNPLHRCLLVSVKGWSVAIK